MYRIYLPAAIYKLWLPFLMCSVVPPITLKCLHPFAFRLLLGAHVPSPQHCLAWRSTQASARSDGDSTRSPMKILTLARVQVRRCSSESDAWAGLPPQGAGKEPLRPLPGECGAHRQPARGTRPRRPAGPAGEKWLPEHGLGRWY